jgi:hypothetical protein
MENDTISFIPHKEFIDRAESFYNAYELVQLIGNDDPKYSKRSLKPSRKRMCRFCKRAYPEVRFSNYSHLLPRLIGNSNLYSDFECDSCNEMFSKIENDLAEFLGVSRSFATFDNEKKTPGFRAKRLHTKSRSFVGNNILIIAPDDVEMVENRTTLRYFKNAFVPSNVYKALLKCALSLLDEKTVNVNYGRAMDYLMGRIVLTERALMSGYKYSFILNLPLHVCIFQKKRKEDNIHSHVLIFNFQNNMISLTLPLNTNDGIQSSQELSYIVPPPYFANEGNMNVAMPIPFLRDLASTKKIVDEEERVTLQFDPNQLRNTTSFDPATGETKQHTHGPESLKYLIAIAQGASFNKEELSEFIKYIQEQTQEST